jgi:hypothetical protein
MRRRDRDRDTHIVTAQPNHTPSIVSPLPLLFRILIATARDTPTNAAFPFTFFSHPPRPHADSSKSRMHIVQADLPANTTSPTKMPFGIILHRTEQRKRHISHATRIKKRKSKKAVNPVPSGRGKRSDSKQQSSPTRSKTRKKQR